MEDSLEMERDAVPPSVVTEAKRRSPMADFRLDMPSIGDRIQEHFTSRGHSNLLLPDLIARIAVPIYFFTTTSTWYLGMFEVMPAMYRDSPPEALFWQRIFMMFIYVEMMANWLCIRYVDSSYVRYLKQRWTKGRGQGGPQGGRDDGSLSQLLQQHQHTASSAHNGLHGPENTHLSQQHHNNGSLTPRPHPHPQHHAPHHAAEMGTLTTTTTTQATINGTSSSSSSSINPPWKPAFRPPRQTSFPYWSWVPCYVCELMRPPRCHHCPLCQTCVLKRDHHCFFAGNCVGWRNQRHFLVFCCWALFGCCYASCYGLRFFVHELWWSEGMRWFDLLAPVTLLRWLCGYVSGLVCLSVSVQSLLVYFMLLSGTFVNEHLQLIRRGLTSFEVTNLKKTVELRDCRSLGARFRSVLGPWWALSLLCPLHWLWEAEEDPENWPSVKVHRH